MKAPATRYRIQKLFFLFIILLSVCVCLPQNGYAQSIADKARMGLRKAAKYYSSKVAYRGGYVYYYSEDLQQRWGEVKATSTQIWVQPPGTPCVGAAFVKAYKATGEKLYLDAADAAAQSLIFGQLESGGWSYAIDFDYTGKRSGLYRNGKGKGKNYSSLDDDVSQSALRFLMKLDQVHEFQDHSIHEAVQFGLNALLKAQYSNGGFPQVWSTPSKNYPIIKASYPEYDWRTENKIKEYWNLYTLNDNLAGDVAKTLILAYRTYNDEKYINALKKLGNFLILAQMPEPQTAWCQQYNFEMKPAWARKFEPPAIVSSESFDVMRALMLIYSATNDKKYLEPIPSALAYFETSILPDGQLPRYLELKTNKPLYMKRQDKVYTLTYDDSKLPSHYAFKIKPNLKKIRKAYEQLKNNEKKETASPNINALEKKVNTIIEKLDSQGRWISTYDPSSMSGPPDIPPGFRFLSSRVFSKNMEILSNYLMTLKKTKNEEEQN